MSKYLDKEINIKIYPENKMLIIMSKITKHNKVVWIDPKTTPHVIVEYANKNRLYLEDCPLEIKKSIKNNVEIKGSIYAHKKNGIALCKFIFWLKNTNYSKLNELSAVKKLTV